jgi:hypothetical protein
MDLLIEAAKREGRSEAISRLTKGSADRRHWLNVLLPKGGTEGTSWIDLGEDFEKLIRYEAHLERQFERKLQQFVAWRRAKGELPVPRRSDSGGINLAELLDRAEAFRGTCGQECGCAGNP